MEPSDELKPHKFAPQNASKRQSFILKQMAQNNQRTSLWA
jgi:hypothetical protein